MLFFLNESYYFFFLEIEMLWDNIKCKIKMWYIYQFNGYRSHTLVSKLGLALRNI